MIDSRSQQEIALEARVRERLAQEQRLNHELGRRVVPKRPTSRLDWPRRSQR